MFTVIFVSSFDFYIFVKVVQASQLNQSPVSLIKQYLVTVHEYGLGLM